MGTIDYKTQSIREVTKEMTNGRGADVICDAVGGDVFKECLRRYLTTGDSPHMFVFLEIIQPIQRILYSISSCMHAFIKF